MSATKTSSEIAFERKDLWAKFLSSRTDENRAISGAFDLKQWMPKESHDKEIELWNTLTDELEEKIEAVNKILTEEWCNECFNKNSKGKCNLKTCKVGLVIIALQIPKQSKESEKST